MSATRVTKQPANLRCQLQTCTLRTFSFEAVAGVEEDVQSPVVVVFSNLRQDRKVEIHLRRPIVAKFYHVALETEIVLEDRPQPLDLEQSARWLNVDDVIARTSASWPLNSSMLSCQRMIVTSTLR